jgi:hypothetical protein
MDRRPIFACEAYMVQRVTGALVYGQLTHGNARQNVKTK